MNNKQKLFNFIKGNKEGFSIHLNNHSELKNGFVCSFTHIEKSKNLNILLDKILLTASLFPQLKNEIVLGGWYDNDSKSYFLDLGLCLDDKNHALQLAKQFKQIAIFDLNNFEEIRL